MIIEKKTTYFGSCSLTQAEFDMVVANEIEEIHVSSKSGKLLAVLSSSLLQWLLGKGRIKLLLVKDNPEGAHYYVVNFGSAGARA